MCVECGMLVNCQQKKKVPEMGMIGQPQRQEIHWEDLPIEAFPIVAPEHTEETDVEMPAWLDPNKAPAEPELVPVPLKQGDGA